MKLFSSARMYSVTPEAEEVWQELFGRITREAGVELQYLPYPAPQLLAELWSRPDLGMCFMCGWPFYLAGSRHQVLAAPVPSGGIYQDRPRYFTHFVVRQDSGYSRLQDTFGGVLAYTVKDSHSGYNALRHHLLPFREKYGPKLYRRVDGPNHGYHLVLQALQEKRVDVGPVDSYSWDLLGRYRPELTAGLRILASTGSTPIPLLVASPGVDKEICRRLSRALCSADEFAPDLLERLCLRRFARADLPEYGIHQQRAEMAIKEAYEELA